MSADPTHAPEAPDLRVATLVEEHRTAHAVEQLARIVGDIRADLREHREEIRPILDGFAQERTAEMRARAEARAAALTAAEATALKAKHAEQEAELEKKSATAKFWRFVAIVGAIISLAVSPTLNQLIARYIPGLVVPMTPVTQPETPP